MVSSDPAPQISSADLEGKPSNTSTFNLNTADQDTILMFGSNSSPSVAGSQLPSGDSDMVLAVPTVSSSVVSSTAASSQFPDSGRSQSVFSAKVLSGARNNSNFNSARFNNFQKAQQTSDASESRFQSTFENKADSNIVLAPPIVFSSDSSNPAVTSSLFASVGGRQSTLAPILPDTNTTEPGVFSTMLTNSTSSNLDDSTKTSPTDNATCFAGTWSNQVQSGSSHISESLGSNCHSTSGNRANGGSVMPAFGVSSFASSSTVPSLFFNTAGSQSALAPTLSGKSNSHSNMSSGSNNTGSSLPDKSAKTSSTVTSTGFDAVQSTTQAQSGAPLISNSSPNQFPSFFPSSTLGTNIASSSSFGSLQFGATSTNSKPSIPSSSFSAGAGFSSFSTTATTTTTLPPSLFGSDSQSPALPAFGGFVSSSSSGGFGSISLPSTFNAPFIFGSSSNPAFSASSGHPAVGFSSGSPRDTQMSIEVSLAADVNLSTGSMVQQFSQPGTSFAATVFGVPGTSSPFQSGCQQNSSPQPFLPQFQASGSAGFPQGGRFAMGSGGGGGGGDKSSRRIVKIRRDKRKK